MDYDVIVVGAGHNGLITAGYLAQAGYRVAVFERDEVIGGAVQTREIVPGYRFDLGGSAHILIHLTSVVEDLELERYGLEYLFLDPLFAAPEPGAPTAYIYRDAERTAEHLDRLWPGEGAAYRQFLEDWTPFAHTMKEMFLARPSPFELGKSLLFGESPSLPWHEVLGTVSRPYGEIVDDYFSEERLKAMLVWMGAQSGPPPHEPLTAPFLLWHPLYHESGIARPRGGSGELTQALGRQIEDHGGQIHRGAPVEEILVEGNRATGIRTGGEIYTSRAVVGAAHARITLSDLLPERHRPSGWSELEPEDGFGLMLRLALDDPVPYPDEDPEATRTGLQMLCRDRRQIRRAYGDYLAGRPASDPPLLAMTFSAVDDTLAPEGGAVCWVWGQYFPYELAGNEPAGDLWEKRAAEVRERVLEQFERYAPGVRSRIVGELFQHPAWLEEHLALPRGNVMHLDMRIHRMFARRPLPGMSGYRSHLDGLYLTGASTHPGGGIMGASGQNAARTLLKDLSRNRL